MRMWGQQKGVVITELRRSKRAKCAHQSLSAKIWALMASNRSRLAAEMVSVALSIYLGWLGVTVCDVLND